MTAINFPDSPSDGDTHVVGGVTYTYNNAETKWKTTINSNAFLPLTGGTVSGNILMGGEIQHDGDTDTNIAFDTDTILFDTAGSERFRVGSAGQLGIGGATYGTDGQVLTSTGDSSAPAWETLTTGKILQVVQTVKTDGFTSTSTTLTDVTGLSVSITPSSSSNKILVLVDCAVGGNNGYVMLQLVRGSTNIYSGTDSKTYIASKNFYVNSANVMGSLAMVYLDSPATTSSVTYKIQMKMSSSLTGCINRRPSDDTSMASGITVLEVAA